MVDVTGVEILAMEEIVVDNAFNWVAFAIVFCSIVAVFVLVGIIMSMKYDDWKQLLVGVVVGTIMGASFGAATGAALGIPTEYETQYKVIITDEVSMDDFFFKYELIEQDGRIYTVTER